MRATEREIGEDQISKHLPGKSVEVGDERPCFTHLPVPIPIVRTHSPNNLDQEFRTRKLASSIPGEGEGSISDEIADG